MTETIVPTDIGIDAASAWLAGVRLVSDRCQDACSVPTVNARPADNWKDVDGLTVLCRSVGNEGAPIVLLPHGLPSFSHIFRDMIPEPSGQSRAIAPTLSGFGMTERLARNGFRCSFKTIEQVITRFTEMLGRQRLASTAARPS